MAMQMTVSTTDKRDGKALALFARHDEWQRGHTKDGRPFFAIPGSQPGLFHMTDTRECSCHDFQQSRNLCKHVRAVRLWMAAFSSGAVAPKPRPDADDVVVLTPHGAACLAELSEPAEPAPQSVTTWRPCERNCGALLPPEHLYRFCDHCSERLRRLLTND